MTPTTRWRLLALLGVGATLAAVAISPKSMVAWQLSYFLVLFALIIPVHELGHAIAAAAVGFRVASIVVGTGPPLGAFRFLGVEVQINLLPLGGLTMALPRRPYPSLRLRQWILTAGGPAANVLIYVALRRVFGTGIYDREHHPIVETARSVNWMILVMNLIPFRTAEGSASDGFGLFTIPFWPRARVEATNLMLQGSLLHRSRQHDAAGAAWRRALALATDPRQVAMLKNNLAWLAVIGGRDGDLAEADRLSADAVTAFPGIAAIKGTRGAVLLRLGRAGEALPLLVAAESGAFEARSRAFDRALMASALAALGRRDEARARLGDRRADPGCELIARAETDIAAAPLTPPIAAIGTVTAAAPPTAAGIDGGIALRAWRRDMRILAFATVLIGAERLDLDLVLAVIAIVMSLAPDLSGAYALAGFGLSAALLHALGVAAKPPFSAVTTGRAEYTLIALALGAAAAWLIARHRRMGPPPASRTPAVLGWIMFSLILLQMLPSFVTLAFDHAPLAVHDAARMLLALAPALIGFAVFLANRARRDVRRLAVVPALIVLVAMVPGSRWYLDHVALAGVPEQGPAPAFAAATAAKVVRTARLTARGHAPALSPGGRAFLLEEFEAHLAAGDKRKSRFVLHVGDFDGHVVDVEAMTGAFIDDERLIIVRPRAKPDGVGTLAEVRPFRGPEPVWTKPMPDVDASAIRIRVDRSSGEIFFVPTGGGHDDAPLGWRTTAEPDTKIEPSRLRQRAGDHFVAVVPGADGGDAALVSRGDFWSGELLWRTPRGERRLISQRLRVECADPLPGASQLWCFTTQVPILLRIDVDGPRVTRVPGEIARGQPKMLGPTTLASCRGEEIEVLDLKAWRGARLTLPEAAQRGMPELVEGGLATIDRGHRGDDPARTLRVYEMPAGFP
jgi:hypothetical protein